MLRAEVERHLPKKLIHFHNEIELSEIEWKKERNRKLVRDGKWSKALPDLSAVVWTDESDKKILRFDKLLVQALAECDSRRKTYLSDSALNSVKLLSIPKQKTSSWDLLEKYVQSEEGESIRIAAAKRGICPVALAVNVIDEINNLVHSSNCSEREFYIFGNDGNLVAITAKAADWILANTSANISNPPGAKSRLLVYNENGSKRS